jgi:hypothetical protein
MPDAELESLYLEGKNKLKEEYEAARRIDPK